MQAKPDPRHEKNRHHLATVVSVLFGALLYLGLYSAFPSTQWICQVSAVVMGVVCAGRTLVIESSVRRKPIGYEAAFEQRSRNWIARHFGIVAVEDIPCDSQQG